MASVSFRNVFKYYNKNSPPSVRDLNLDVADGEFLVLVGPSGCGKSTTLRMLAGLESISEGDIYIGDRMINYVSPKDRDIAMVFQNYALYPNLSVYENMALGLKMRKVTKSDIEQKVKQFSRILEISHLLDKKPGELSGGQKQRVALGRAIVREPQVFLMDEPLSNLDAKLRTQTRTEIIKLHRELQTTTVYVTHDQTEAMTMGTRIVVMKDGIIQQVAKPEDIYKDPANLFVASFIGSPGINLIKGAIAESGDHYIFHNKRLRFSLPAHFNEAFRTTSDNLRSVVVGVRPEHIAISMGRQEEGADDTQTWTVPARVEMIELMGSESFVYLKLGDDNIVCKAEADTELEIGSVAEIRFQMEKAHFFSEASGLSILRK